MTFEVDNSAVEAYTKKLMALNRSAFSVAVRQTLNSAAFDVKQTTMPKSAQKEFVNRSKNFFKATSTVEMARGFDVNNMAARIGFDEGKAKATGNKGAVSDLEQQEHGTEIKPHPMMPLDEGTRVGRSRKKSVRANARLKAIKDQKIVFQRDAPGKSPGAKFAKSVAFAGKGGLVLGEYKGKKILWRVNDTKPLKGGKFKLTGLYLYDKGHAVKPPATHFMKNATLESGQKINDTYIMHAEKQFAKALNG